MSLPRELKDVQIRMTRIIWDLGKKNLIWREIEKISGVYGGRELNKKVCDKSLCCQGYGKGKRGMEKRKPRGVSVPEPVGRGAAEPSWEDIGQRGGKAGGIGKEPEILLGLRTWLGLQRDRTHTPVAKTSRPNSMRYQKQWKGGWLSWFFSTSPNTRHKIKE